MRLSRKQNKEKLTFRFPSQLSYVPSFVPLPQPNASSNKYRIPFFIATGVREKKEEKKIKQNRETEQERRKEGGGNRR